MNKQMFNAIKTATSNPYPVVLWWDDKSIAGQIDTATTMGYIRRVSITQAELTERGLEAMLAHKEANEGK